MNTRHMHVLAPLTLGACLIAGISSVNSAGLSAQGPSATTPPVAEAIKAIQWRNIGPTAQAGRVPVFVGLPGDINTMYVAGAVGGIFKTTNGGVTWRAIFDNQPVASIGASPSHPLIRTSSMPERAKATRGTTPRSGTASTSRSTPATTG